VLLQKKKSKTLEIQSQVGESCVVDGDLTSNDNIKIDGRVNGSVATRGTIVIGDLGYVGGDLMGSDIYIEGEVTGNVKARGRVVMSKTAKIGGAITADTFTAEKGAVYNSVTTANQAETPPAQEAPETFASNADGASKVKLQTKDPIIEDIRSRQEPTKQQFLSEEEEKEAFLKTFYFNPDNFSDKE
jgi:cytoskeletal protein CcmA (bactofilin family)